MSVEQAFIEQWSRYMPLAELVPQNRVWKGRAPQEDEDQEAVEMPYVTMLAEDPNSTRTSDNIYTTANLRMSVYAATDVEAERIANEAKDYFDGIGGTWLRGTILDCKWNGTTREDDEDDGSWFLLVQFGVTVSEARKPALMRNG